MGCIHQFNLYPVIVAKKGLQGDVEIDIVVNQKGEVEHKEALKSDSNLFTDTALRAIAPKAAYKTLGKIIQLFLLQSNSHYLFIIV